ncbi:MAG: hypothetical protein RR615_01535 [Morganella sp. (in: enterobacteria)]
MSVMNKPDYKIFAKDAKSGELVTFPDILRGWGITLEQYNGFPPMELFNSAAKRIDEWLMYLTQRGLPEWDASVDYPKDALIQHAGVYYVALKVSKGEQPNNSQTSWKKMSDFLGVDGKLTKNENGADIPNKPKFIENLGLGEAAKSGLVQTTGTSTTNVMSQKSVTDELNKKFDKTGGKITGRVDIAPASGRALTVNQEKPGETSNYMEFYFADVLAAWFGITLGKRLTIANTVAGKSLTIDPDGFKIDGKNIAITDQLLGIGQTYKDVTSSRKNGATYTNNSTKPIIVYVETNRTASSENDPYSIGGDVNGLRVAYRWTTANETMSISFIVPPGASYMFKGGWGQTHSWEPVIKVVELS